MTSWKDLPAMPDIKPITTPLAEITPMPISMEERQTRTLAMLYELRLQTLLCSDAATRLGWLSAGFKARQAHDLLCQALTELETAHPELT